MKMNKFCVLAVTTGVFFLSGCAVKEAPPLMLYTFDTAKVALLTRSAYRHQVLEVSYPQTLREPIGDTMAFSYGGGDRGYYQNAQWTNNIGKLLQGDIIETLQQSRLFKAVVSYASTAQEDLRLESTIYDFSHHIRGVESYAVVSIGLSLIDTHTRRVIKTKRFSYREATPTVDAKGYVTATNRALERFNNDMVAWIHNSISHR